jgi:hypothetical protein
VQLQGGNSIDNTVAYQYVTNTANVLLLDAPQEGLVNLNFSGSLQFYP